MNLPFRDSDLPRLQATVAEWIARAGRCGYDHIGELPHRIYENLRGRELGELVRLWVSDGHIVGVAICVRFGAAFDVLVAPELRGTALEREMLLVAYRITAASSDEPYVLTDVFDCDSARLRILVDLGFARYRVWDDVTELSLGTSLPEFALPPGFTVRSASFVDADGLGVARNLAFDHDWAPGQYLSSVMTKPGYDPAREIVAVAPDGRIAAFAVYWTDSVNRLGHFEPVGTHPSFQRRGLARAVMLFALQRMRAEGMEMVSVNYNAENLAAGRLYESLGFAKRYQTLGFRCPIADRFEKS